MAEIPDVLLVHTVLVKAYQGINSHNQASYGDSKPLACFWEGKTQVVRNPVGEEVVSNVTLYAKPAAEVRELSLIALDGVLFKHRVVTLMPHTDGGLGSWEHLEVLLEAAP